MHALASRLLAIIETIHQTLEHLLLKQSLGLSCLMLGHSLHLVFSRLPAGVEAVIVTICYVFICLICLLLELKSFIIQPREGLSKTNLMLQLTNCYK